jgi:hypothetical protein
MNIFSIEACVAFPVLKLIQMFLQLVLVLQVALLEQVFLELGSFGWVDMIRVSEFRGHLRFINSSVLILSIEANSHVSHARLENLNLLFLASDVCLSTSSQSKPIILILLKV